MSTRLFDRIVEVQFGSPNTTGKSYTDLRVDFDIHMTDGSEPNEGRIEVFNLSKTSVADLQKADAIVRLLVGYRSLGGTTRQIFQGNPIPGGVTLDRSGVDRILTIEAQDGGREYTATHVSETFATATTSAQLFAALSERLGLPLGNVAAVVGSVSFPHGLALNGRVSDQLDRVAALSGARWGIRDGALQVWEAGGSTGEEAVVFSAEAGNLIGAPKVKDDGIEITGLLAPTLRPGRPFRIESETLTGDYVATTVNFKGSSGFATDFYVIASGTPL